MAHERPVRPHESQLVPDDAKDRRLGRERRHLAASRVVLREVRCEARVLHERAEGSRRKAEVGGVAQVGPAHHAEGLRVAVEEAEVVPDGIVSQLGRELFGPGLDRRLAGVAVGRVANVVRKAGRLHGPAHVARAFGRQIAARHEERADLARERIAHGRHFDGVRETVVDVIHLRERMDLRLARKAAKRRGEHDALVVDLVGRARVGPMRPRQLHRAVGGQPHPLLREQSAPFLPVCSFHDFSLREDCSTNRLAAAGIFR